MSESNGFVRPSTGEGLRSAAEKAVDLLRHVADCGVQSANTARSLEQVANNLEAALAHPVEPSTGEAEALDDALKCLRHAAKALRKKDCPAQADVMEGVANRLALLQRDKNGRQGR